MEENNEKTVENGDSGSKTNAGSSKKWRSIIVIALLLLVGAVAAHAIIAKNRVCNKNLACDIYGTQTAKTCPKTAKMCPKTQSCTVKEDSTKKCPLTEKTEKTASGCALKEKEKTACTRSTAEK